MQQELGIWSNTLLTECQPRSFAIVNSTDVLYLCLGDTNKRMLSKLPFNLLHQHTAFSFVKNGCMSSLAKTLPPILLSGGPLTFVAS